jgi:starch-binding outer membrane protein, SusD/RagB family
MKIKIKIIAAALCSVFVLNSCSDFLEENNKVGMTADLTYSTASGIRGLMASCYSFARGWYGKEPALGLAEMGSDLFYYGFDNKQKSLNSYSITSLTMPGVNDNACLDEYWEMFYSAVDVCNNALYFVPKNTVINDTEKNIYLGEAHFMRAFYYFHMVNMWGDIPYNDEPVRVFSTTPVRLPEAEVYTKILQDLDKSIQAFETANYKTKADGRANYWAARALKARVLLYEASWLNKTASYALAKAEAEAVIASNYASFYTNYADTWNMANENAGVNKESIFGITYSSDLMTNVNCIPKRYRTNANGDPLDYNALITRTGYTRGGNAMLLMFVSMWNNGASDLGGNGKEVFIRALGETTYYVTNTKTGEKVYVAEHYSPYGRGFTRYLPSLYLWDLLEKNRATDQRPDATLLTAYTIPAGLAGSSTKYPLMKDTAIYYSPLDGNSPEGIAMQEWAKNRYRIQFMYNGDIPVYSSGNPADALPTEANKAVSAVYGDNRYANNIGGFKSFPGLKKFLDNKFDPLYPTHDISYRDAIVIRLSEMYLIKAECEIHAGGNALATINQLRDVRALPGKTVENRRTGPVTIDTILEERAIELCGEMQRWFDLKRTRKLVDYVKARNAQAKANVAAKHLYRPIPQVQMDAVTNPDIFKQNPDY